MAEIAIPLRPNKSLCAKNQKYKVTEQNYAVHLVTIISSANIDTNI